MTPEKAITTLELAISEVEWNYPLDISIALVTAIEALKKQILKKLKKHGYGKWYFCPDCLRLIQKRSEDSLHDIKFCPFCGRALEWGEDEC